MRGACPYVLAAYDARGRFLLAVRQSAPSGTSHRGFVPRPGLRLLVTGSIHLHGQNSLCRFAAEAKIQDRSRDKTGPNTAPAFLRAPRHSRGGGNPEKNKARRLTSPLPRWERARVRVTPRTPAVIPAEAGIQRKTKHTIYPFREAKGARKHAVFPAGPAPYPDTGAGTQRKTKHAD